MIARGMNVALFLPIFRYIFGFALLACAGLFGSELTVRLATETPLVPLYLAKTKAQDTEFTAEYLDALEAVLAFDLAHNGATQLVLRSPEKEQLASKTGEDPRAHLEAWKEQSVLYVVLAKVEANHLALRLVEVQSGRVKELNDVALSGRVAEDRRRMHLVSDTLHYEITGKPGIASTRLLFTRRIIDPEKGVFLSEVWQADYDGANCRQATHEGAYCVTPVFLPPKPGQRSQQFLYVSYKTGQPKIMHASLTSGKAQAVTRLRGNQLLPAVSPQRDRLAFICDAAGSADLFVQPFDPDAGAVGKPQQIFSLKRSTQGSPSFSPDGKRIAFVSNKAGPAKIYLMEVPKPGARMQDLHLFLITVKARTGTAPSWSADSKKIAFCSSTEGVRQIWVYDVETGQEKQLTFGPGHKENPSFAPDSMHLLYNSANPNEAELYLLDLHRLQPVKLELGEGEKHYPSWEPR